MSQQVSFLVLHGCIVPRLWFSVAGLTRHRKSSAHLHHRMRSKQAISRILFSEAITRYRNDDHSSRMPIARHLKRPTQGLGRAARCIPLFGLAPGGVYPASPVTRRTGALLPHHFTLTSPKQGGILSVALAFALPRLHVMEHPALWCSDFPPVPQRRDQRSSGLLRPQNSISFYFRYYSCYGFRKPLSFI